MKAFSLALLLAGMPLVLLSCKDDRASGETLPPPVIHPQLEENQLADTPSTFLRSAADSPVHWQRWNPDLLEKAADSRRLIFAVIGSARYPGTYETLRVIDRSPAIVERLNQEFVPVLVDLDINRETSLMASALSTEARQSVSFPFLLLLSPEGAPVSWQPLSYTGDDAIHAFFENSVEVVSRLWDESANYVMSDSSTKNELRAERAPHAPQPDPVIADRAERLDLYRQAVRRLTSFYDEDVSQLSGAGGLFPLGTLKTLSDASHHPELPETLREQAVATRDGILGSLMRSAMFDPLDGGIYTARRGSSWDLPLFVRDCASQARVVRELCRLHQDGARPDPLPAALGSIDFVESNYRTPEGLFAMAARPGETPEKEYLWTVDAVRAALDDREFQVWDAMSGLENLGNLPSEADPRRRFFRLNSLGMRQSFEEVAAEVGLNANEVHSAFESGRKKLLKAREQRFRAPASDTTPSASASFRMVSAYAALYAATGDNEWRTKAVALGQLCRQSFGASRFLNERPGENPEEMSDGRALAYGIATRAALDLGAVTLDEEWYSWAQDLTTLLGEHFVTDDGRLIETRESARVIALTYEDRLMVFEDSTAGLARENLARLGLLGFQTPPALKPWTLSLPALHQFPIVHTDALDALAYETLGARVQVGPGTDAALRDAVTRLPLGRFARRADAAGDVGVEVTLPSGETLRPADPAAIEGLVNAEG